MSPRLTEEERREAIVDSTLDTIAGAVVSHMLEARVNADQPVSHTSTAHGYLIQTLGRVGELHGKQGSLCDTRHIETNPWP